MELIAGVYVVLVPLQSLFEIITSEASYLKSLKVLVQQFVQSPSLTGKLSSTCVLDVRDQHVLFSNVKAVRDVSAKWVHTSRLCLQSSVI